MFVWTHHGKYHCWERTLRWIWTPAFFKLSQHVHIKTFTRTSYVTVFVRSRLTRTSKRKCHVSLVSLRSGTCFFCFFSLHPYAVVESNQVCLLKYRYLSTILRYFTWLFSFFTTPIPTHFKHTLYCCFSDFKNVSHTKHMRSIKYEIYNMKHCYGFNFLTAYEVKWTNTTWKYLL